MEKLIIEPTKSTPLIDFDPVSRVLLLKGESYPEYAAKFYGPVFSWLTAFFEEGCEEQTVTVNIEITYFNSSSSKALMNIFDILEEAAEKGNNVVVNWRYDKENEAAEECGEEFMEDLEHVKFNMVKM